MTIRQGKIGDEVVTTRTTTSAVQCRGAGTLLGVGADTIELDTVVTESTGSGRCLSVGEQTLTALDGDRVRYQAGEQSGVLTRKG
ncbi:hypothetical protein ACFXA3_02645 [Streptomyces sp. NPDC059456]|uniref:hypothetical protein n=1 Tax=Streptomyces sp. NPDC059456 TaxID=3346838 RepID=UPI00367A473F